MLRLNNTPHSDVREAACTFKCRARAPVGVDVMRTQEEKMRGFEKQFDKEIALRIRQLVVRLESMDYPTGPSRYYGLDLVLCLRGGAMLGSLIVSTALLEAYVRALVTNYSTRALIGRARRFNPERELETMKGKGFGAIVDDLASCGLFLKADAKTAKHYYKFIRIPAHHGLSSRLVEGDGESTDLSSIFPDLNFLDPCPVSLREFEDFIEEKALAIIEDIVAILERNRLQSNT